MRAFYQKLFALRWFVIGAYLLLVIPAAYFAAQVETDNSLDRMIVPTLHEKKVFDRFRKVFGSDEFILIALQGKELYTEKFLGTFDEIERRIQNAEHVHSTRSLISIYRQMRPLFNPAEKDDREAFKKFTLSTPFFNRQGLIAPNNMLTIVVQMDIHTSKERKQLVASLNDILAEFETMENSPFQKIRKVGEPYINYELDKSSNEIGAKFFPFFMLFAMGLIVFLYRSMKGMLIVLITIGVSIAFSVASVVLLDSMFTLISAVLPVMVLIVTIETIIHIYSGYVRLPKGKDEREHIIDTLQHKFQACAYSVLTTAVGFGSFVLSPVMPIRDLGLFVAISLAISFVVSFTLFPILLDYVRPKTQNDNPAVGFKLFDPILRAIPGYTHMFRLVLVVGMTLIGAFGIHSFFEMEMETNTINYLSKDSDIYQDTIYVENNLMGLLSMEIMLDGEKGQFASPETMRVLQEYEQDVYRSLDVHSLLSPATMLKTANFIENKEDEFPRSNFTISKYIMALSQQDLWSTFVSEEFDKYRISAITKSVDHHVFNKLKLEFTRLWSDFVEEHPEFDNVKLVLTGYAPLMANINTFLYETLITSFGLTLLVIFFVFLLEIRRLTFALLAMLPSIFAILLMYLGMTLAGGKLDIGSIVIAAIVLGITVDSTIHFFQHFMEKRKAGKEVAESIGFSLMISGRAIVVSNIVMFSGFITFGLSDFPPIKHFGLLTALAIVISLFGTLLYLPACLWLMNPKAKPKRPA